MVFTFGVLLGKKVDMHPSKTQSLAKTMTECYDYLFELAIKMRGLGLDPAEVPADSEYKNCLE